MTANALGQQVESHSRVRWGNAACWSNDRRPDFLNNIEKLLKRVHCRAQSWNCI